MSWSVSAVGKAGAVASDVAKQFSSAPKCPAPEETIRQAAAALLATVLAAQSGSQALKISAWGSTVLDANGKSVASSQLSITVDPIIGFVG